MISRKNGITLAELLISVAILGVIALVMPVAMRILNAVRYQQQISQANSQIQVFFNQLSIDIHNAPRFDFSYNSFAMRTDLPVGYVSEYRNEVKNLGGIQGDPDGQNGDYIILASLDTYNLEFSNPLILNPQNWGMIVYYLRKSNKPAIVRHVFFHTDVPLSVPSPNPTSGGFSSYLKKTDKVFLEGIVRLPQAGEKIFYSPLDPLTGGVKRDAVKIDLKVRYPFMKTHEFKEFSEEIMRWSSTWN